MTGSNCPFCQLDAARIAFADDVTLVIRDAFPVSPGHTLFSPRRHVGSFFELTPPQRASMFELLTQAKAELDETLQPDGFNIGINVGKAAGQTVFHLHFHLIPRYSGDVPDPSGGVRHVIPGKGNYLAGK